MKSPQPQDAPQLLPADRVTGVVHRLPVLVQEKPALVYGQVVQDPLRVERIVALGRPLVFHAAAKDAQLEPGVAIRGVLETMFDRVPADAEDASYSRIEGLALAAGNLRAAAAKM